MHQRSTSSKFSQQFFDLNAILNSANQGNREAAEKLVEKYEDSETWQEEEKIENWLRQQINQHNSVFLHWLAYLGETEFYKKLIQIGAIYQKDANGRLPIHYAVQENMTEVLSSILEDDIGKSKTSAVSTDKLEIYTKNNQNLTPISMAVQANNLKAFNVMKKAKQSFVKDSYEGVVFTQNVSSIPTVQLGGMSLNPTVNKYYTGGQPQWSDVVCTEPKYDWIADPTGQIISVLENSEGVKDRFCSGFNIGNKYFLTAGHCIGDVCYSVENEEVNNYRISFNYQYPICSEYNKLNTAGSIQETTYNIKEVVEHGTCNGTDFAIFRLSANAEKLFGKVDITTDIPPNGHEVVLAHHPDGLPKKISEGYVQRLPSQEEKGEINYTDHTFGGSSGSPVGSIEKKVALGVHVKDNRDLQTVHLGLTVKEIATQSAIVKNIAKTGFFGGSSSNQIPQQQNNHTSNQYQGSSSGGSRYRLTRNSDS